MTDLPPPPASQQPASQQPPGPQRRGRWVAIVTGAISVLVGVLYLLLIVVLDSRGPLQPPPPEALGSQALGRDPVGIGPPSLSDHRGEAAAADPGAAAAPPRD